MGWSSVQTGSGPSWGAESGGGQRGGGSGRRCQVCESRWRAEEGCFIDSTSLSCVWQPARGNTHDSFMTKMNVTSQRGVLQGRGRKCPIRDRRGNATCERRVRGE
ncbi:hypothetical protein O3P69_008868 [Scylla paramamosain]|uniref:Uncharacterized protein n=1 Tax=Scylla paramamosain TaxID=85552 RepID=A0AAW0TQZ3_SCYPA